MFSAFTLAAAAHGVDDALQAGELTLDFIVGVIDFASGGDHDIGFSLLSLTSPDRGSSSATP